LTPNFFIGALWLESSRLCIRVSFRRSQPDPGIFWREIHILLTLDFGYHSVSFTTNNKKEYIKGNARPLMARAVSE